MRNTIKKISVVSIYLLLFCSCNETKTKNMSSKQNDNDTLFGLVSDNLKKSKFQCDSLEMKFVEELEGANGFRGYGPTAKKLSNQMDSCVKTNQKIKVKLDSLFVLTSKEFKVNYYKKVLSEIEIVVNKNKNKLIKSREILKNNKGKIVDFGPKGKALNDEIFLLEKQIQKSKISKDSITNILNKIK